MANKYEQQDGVVLVKRIVQLLLCAPALASAGAWNIVPRATVSETYTDNIRLEPNATKESDLVTEVSPGVHLNKEGGRSKVDLDYELQGLLFANNGSKNDINHKLLGNGQFELRPDWLYFDGAASYTQRNVNTSGRLALDSITGASDLKNVGTITLSPYLKHDFAGQVEALLRFTHDEINYSGGASDAKINTTDLNLKSGRHWRLFTWSLQHHDSHQYRASSSDTQFISTKADVGYRMTDTLRLIGTVGNEDNKYQTSQQVKNGSYAAAGASWRPSRYYALEALYGSKYKSGTLTLNPDRRTDLEVTYTNRDVGVTLGPAWDARLRHRGKRLSLNASYHEDTTTLQQAYIDSIRNVLQDYSTGQIPSDALCTLVSLTECNVTYNEVVERKRAQGSIDYKTGRSTLELQGFNEQRHFLTSLTNERTNGGAASWTWAYTGRTDSTIRGGVQRTLRNASTQEDKLWFAEWTVEHSLTARSKGSVQLRHTVQDSTLASNTYDENRITVRLRVEF